jgi:cardiolipin synthase A/B
MSRFKLKKTAVIVGLFSSFSIQASPFETCRSLLYPHADWIAEVEKDPVLGAHAREIEKFLTTYAFTGRVDQAAAEKEILTTLATLRDQDKLRIVLAQVVHEVRKKPGFPPIPGDDAAVANQLFSMIDAELYARGYSPLGVEATFKNWKVLAREQTKAVLKSQTSKIRSPAFADEFWSFVRAPLHEGASAKLINDAKSALNHRIRMIKNAKKSVWVATWAIYGDNAGTLFADLLIAKFKSGIDVRVIVDGQTAERIGYRESVEKLRKAGVPTIEWRSKTNPYFGQHRKFMLVDHETGVGEAVAGGRNFGDDYLHTGTKPNAPKWRDTDILYQGEPVAENARRFRTLWNEQVERLGGRNTISESRVGVRQAKAGNVRMGIIDHTPNAAGYDPIYLGLLKSIEASTTSIDISNAYVILTPAMRDAILRARARGVRVRVFTNSARSIDEPIVTAPILNSLAELLPSGVEVYVKNGDTLHSKFAIFDGEVTWVMSYNLHPRSLRYEGESANVVFDADFSAVTVRDFEKDLAQGQRIRTKNDLGIQESKASALGTAYFFDQF